MRRLRQSLFFCAAAFALIGPAGAQPANAPPVDAKLARARLAGPADEDVQAFIARRDEAVKPYYRQLFVEGERNAVLNFSRLGLIELERHHVKDAAWLLDRAADRIEAIYANDPNAEKAKSLWNSESVKDFKGEPYERAMTFYYRGLARLMMKDYENARANFRRAEEQTLISETENYQKSSFAALSYLAGWASHCAGDDARAAEFYKVAGATNDRLVAPPVSDNFLLISEVGSGPTKTGAGQYREQLRMVAGSPANVPSQFVLPPDPALAAPPKLPAGNFAFDVASENPAAHTPTTLHAILASDLSEQSMMRDGRQVDVILKGKAQFKEGADIAGTVGIMGGTSLMQQALASNNMAMANMGAGFALFGVVASIAAEAATPAADVRYWDNLPAGIEVATARLPADAANGKWQPDGAASASDMYVVKGPVCTVAWLHQNSDFGPPSAPNSDPARRVDSQRLKTDAAFRASLLNDFPAPFEGGDNASR